MRSHNSLTRLASLQDAASVDPSAPPQANVISGYFQPSAPPPAAVEPAAPPPPAAVVQAVAQPRDFMAIGATVGGE